MRVVIDATPLLIRSAGVKSYLYYWLEHLRRAAGTDTIGTFPSLGAVRPLSHEHSVAGSWETFWGLASLAISNYTPVPAVAWNAGRADIFHTSTLLRHPPGGARLTATIHDLTCWLMPELHPASNIVADQHFAEVLRKTDGIIADSQSTKNDAVKVLGLAEDKITVIYPGIPRAFFHVSPESIEQVRTRYRLDRPFILSIGTIEPRKNVDALLDAYDSLPADLRKEFELVLAGPIGWAKPETVARLQNVRYLGYLPEPDIAPLTAAATIFTYPSLYEGFGFPVAQAMAAGVPVVTSNVSSLPEVSGGAALLVDPRSPAEISAAIQRFLGSAELRGERSEMGRSRAQEFQWEVCAVKSLEFFERVFAA